MKRLVLIDDDTEIAEDLAELLRSEGHHVRTLNTTQGAVEVLIEEKPDLLILDVMFPENPVAGFELSRKIRGTDKIKGLPILLLTGVNQELPMHFSASDIDPDWMPVQDFVDKPIDLDVLLSKVDKMTRMSDPISHTPPTP